MNELEIITENDGTIILELAEDKSSVCICIDDYFSIANTRITLSQAKQIVNFLNQVL